MGVCGGLCTSVQYLCMYTCLHVCIYMCVYYMHVYSVCVCTVCICVYYVWYELAVKFNPLFNYLGLLLFLLFEHIRFCFFILVCFVVSCPK